MACDAGPLQTGGQVAPGNVESEGAKCGTPSPPKVAPETTFLAPKWCPDSGRQTRTITLYSLKSSARKVGAILGPGFGLLGNSGADHGYISEAAATWQWSNFLEAQAAPGQVVVHINLDETCVKLCPSVPRGAVAIDGGSTKKEALEQERPEPFAWQTQLRRHRLQTPQSRTKFLYSHTAPARLKNSSLGSTDLSKLVHIFWLGQEQVYR